MRNLFRGTFSLLALALFALAPTSAAIALAPPAPSAAAEKAAEPGIALTVAGPVGRTAFDSPVYFGAERIASASAYQLTILSPSNTAPSFETLEQGTTDSFGSFSSMVRLPQLAPGTYNIVFSGLDPDGLTLELTSQITINEAGEFTSIGANSSSIK